jgi:transcriptional regulator with XRE-family HTH domain
MEKKALPFSGLLLQLREERAWSLRQAATVAGVSNAYLSQLESGRAGPPSPRILERLARAYDYSYGELMRVAGHINTGPEYQDSVLRLENRTYEISALTPDEKARLAEFLDALTQTRSRSAV